MFKVLSALLCLPILGIAGGDFSAWKDSTRVFINTTATGANLPTFVDIFPLLVRLDSASLTWANVHGNGADLRFADPDGRPLPHEVELFDAAARKAAIWVQVPRVDAQSLTDHIVMYWNNAAAASVSDGGAVFDTAWGYAGVWHFAEDMDGVGAKDVFKDATRNANHGDDYASTGRAPGIIGSGKEFDADDRVQVDNSPSVALAGPLSFSAWVTADWLSTTSSNANVILRKGDANPNSYQLGVYNQKFFLALDADDGAGVQSKTVVALNKYYHIAATWEGASVKLYVNGELENESTIPKSAGSLSKDARPLYIGSRVINPNDINSKDIWDGDMDEVRMSRHAHSPQHIKLSYENQKAGSSILSFKAYPKVDVPTDDLSLWAKKRKITLNTGGKGANVPGPVDNIPVLVRLDTGNFDFAEALSGGQDIRFSDPGGAILPHAMERWDFASRRAEVWVKVPRVDGNSETDYITMHWGNPAAVHRHAPAAVFDTADGFRGAWHLGDGSTQANPTGGFLDATGHEHHGQDRVLQVTSEALISRGVEFKATTDRIAVPSTEALKFTDSFTLSAWIKGTAWDSVPGSVNTIVRKGELNPNNYQMSVYTGRLSVHLDARDDNGVLGQTRLKTGQWHHVAATFGGGKVNLYVDGKPDLVTPASHAVPLSTDTRALYLGGRDAVGDPGDHFKGMLDEVQISGPARSADWIKLSYENQKAASRFLVHEGFESRVIPVDTVPTPQDTTKNPPLVIRTPWTYDTVLTAGGEIRDSSFSIGNPGPGSVRVIIHPSGDTAAKGVIGVQALLRLIPQSGDMPPLVITLDTLAAAGRSLYQLLPGVDGWGTLGDLGSAEGVHVITEAGAYTMAKDTTAPRLRIVHQGVDGDDSSWVTVLVEDNIRDVNIKCFPSGNSGALSLARKDASGVPFRLAFMPVPEPVPLKITLSVDDGRQQTGFPPPPAMAYTLARSLPDLVAPLSAQSGLQWGLYGLPVQPLKSPTLDAISNSAGAGRLYGAVWTPDVQDSVRGAYRMLGAEDTLPAGTGIWLAGEEGFGSLQLGSSRSFAQAGSAGYALPLRRGWNLITSPALERLPWVVSKQDLAAYDQSPVKGLHAHRGEGGYDDADTLDPWKGYFVYSRADTTLVLTPEGAALAKSSLPKHGIGMPRLAGGVPGAPIQVFLEPVPGRDGSLSAPASLRLGAAGYASDGLAIEDEYMPASPMRTIALGAARARRGLRTDLVGYRAGGTHAWKVAWNGRGADRPADGLLRVTRLDLPPGMELRAATAFGTDARLVGEGDVLGLSGEAADTLVLWAAPKGSWKEGDPVPELSPRPALRSVSFRDGPEGGAVWLALPEAASVRIAVHAADGRRVAEAERTRLAPGYHRLPLASHGRLRAKGLLFVTVELGGSGGGIRSVFKIVRP